LQVIKLVVSGRGALDAVLVADDIAFSKMCIPRPRSSPEYELDLTYKNR